MKSRTFKFFSLIILALLFVGCSGVAQGNNSQSATPTAAVNTTAVALATVTATATATTQAIPTVNPSPTATDTPAVLPTPIPTAGSASPGKLPKWNGDSGFFAADSLNTIIEGLQKALQLRTDPTSKQLANDVVSTLTIAKLEPGDLPSRCASPWDLNDPEVVIEFCSATADSAPTFILVPTRMTRIATQSLPAAHIRLLQAVGDYLLYLLGLKPTSDSQRNCAAGWITPSLIGQGYINGQYRDELKSYLPNPSSFNKGYAGSAGSISLADLCA